MKASLAELRRLLRERAQAEADQPRPMYRKSIRSMDRLRLDRMLPGFVESAQRAIVRERA